jgi:hypothetical protein
MDYNAAVEVRVRNEAGMPITVQAIRSAAIVGFQRTVGHDYEARFLVRHSAFGSGPIRFNFVAGDGRFQRGYRTNKVRVPTGGVVYISLVPDLRRSSVTVYNKHRQPTEYAGRGTP